MGISHRFFGNVELQENPKNLYWGVVLRVGRHLVGRRCLEMAEFVLVSGQLSRKAMFS